MKSFGNNVTEKEHIKEIIEKNGNGENDGLLRDILYAIKEMNFKNQKGDKTKVVVENDPNKREDYLEMKIEIKNLLN